MAIWNALLISGLFALFALIHSLTAGIRLKKALATWLGARFVDGWYRLAYNVVSVLVILPALVLIVWLPDQTLYRASMPWSLFMLAVQAIGLVGIIVALLSTDLWRFAGLAQVFDFLAGKPAISTDAPLQINGVYRIVRHPLYLFSLMVLWPVPVMTFNLLVFNVAATLYFGIGSVLEERRLERVYGDSYRAYRRKVSWLFPWPRLRWPPSNRKGQQ